MISNFSLLTSYSILQITVQCSSFYTNAVLGARPDTDQRPQAGVGIGA